MVFVMRLKCLLFATFLLYLSESSSLQINFTRNLLPWKWLDWKKLSKNRIDAVTSTHPLRHPAWNIEIQAPGIELPSKLQINFHKNGKITTSSPNITGNWHYGPYGIIYTLTTDKGNTYTFAAELCWNNYGESAFFRKGVIYSDRKGRFKFLFRPVHGKFHGKSIGKSNEYNY